MVTLSIHYWPLFSCPPHSWRSVYVAVAPSGPEACWDDGADTLDPAAALAAGQQRVALGAAGVAAWEEACFEEVLRVVRPLVQARALTAAEATGAAGRTWPVRVIVKEVTNKVLPSSVPLWAALAHAVVVVVRQPLLQLESRCVPRCPPELAPLGSAARRIRRSARAPLPCEERSIKPYIRPSFSRSPCCMVCPCSAQAQIGAGPRRLRRPRALRPHGRDARLGVCGARPTASLACNSMPTRSKHTRRRGRGGHGDGEGCDVGRRVAKHESIQGL